MRKIALILIVGACVLLEGDTRKPSIRELSERYPEAVQQAKERLKEVGGVR